MEPQENQPQPQQPAEPEAPPLKNEEEVITQLVIRMWPKTPILYPMAIFALICCIVGSFSGMSPNLSKLKKHFEAQTAQSEAATSTKTFDENGEVVVTEEETSEETTAIDEEIISETVATNTLDFEQVSSELVASLTIDRIMGGLFLLLFAFSLFTLCLDLEVRWALVIFCIGIIVVLGLYILEMQIDFLPDLIDNLFALSPMATPQFYGAVFVIWLILMIISFGIVRFHYVKIESNEIIVVGGLLQREERYSTFRMQYVKDIQDVFEYYLPLVNSGRLIIAFPDERDPIVIDNVLNIDKVTAQLDKLSGVMQVRS